MFIILRWGHQLFDDVRNARGIFVISTQFLEVGGQPFLPERSYLCMLEDATIRRRPRPTVTGAAQGSADTSGNSVVLNYAGKHSRSSAKRVSAYYPIPMHFGSVAIAYAQCACYIMVLAAFIAGLAIGISHSLIAIIATVAFAGLAFGLFMLPRLPRFRDATYEQAVHLALRARVGEAVIERIQMAYGRFPDCAIVHGLPVSSTQVLYVYAEGESDDRSAARIQKDLRRFIRRHQWRLGELWAVNSSGLDEGEPTRELGLIAALPRERPAGWLDEVATIARHFAALHARTGLGFAIGVYDARSRSNQDLFLIDTPEPDLDPLRTALGDLDLPVRCNAAAIQ